MAGSSAMIDLCTSSDEEEAPAPATGGKRKAPPDSERTTNKSQRPTAVTWQWAADDDDDDAWRDYDGAAARRLEAAFRSDGTNAATNLTIRGADYLVLFEPQEGRWIQMRDGDR